MINYVDIIIVLILAYHIVQGIRQGVWPLLARLAAFAGSLFAAFYFYQAAGRFILSHWDLIPSLGYGLGFIAVFIASQILLHIILGMFLRAIPEWMHTNIISRALAVIPAAIDGLIVVSILILIIVVFPVSANLREDVTNSKTGGAIAENLQRAEQYSQKLFGNLLGEALTFFTIRPETNESVRIPYQPENPEVDSEAEEKMLELVNAARTEAGVKPLTIDPVLVEIARNHSRDMWERGYFSHMDPDGKDPFDRMREGGAAFIIGGENLAYAPSVGLAHRGLMNSPGHRRNILDPRFTRIGIGAVSGGLYGTMYTQMFAD